MHKYTPTKIGYSTLPKAPSHSKTHIYMFSPGFVCGFVSVFVCEQDNSNTHGRILMKLSGYVMKNKLGVIRLIIGKNMKYRGGKAISVLMVGFESPGIELPWRRSVLSECSCYYCYYYILYIM